MTGNYPDSLVPPDNGRPNWWLDVLALFIGFPLFILVYLFWHGYLALAWLLLLTGITKRDTSSPFLYARTGRAKR